MIEKNKKKIENAVHDIIEAIGDDPKRPSIKEKPPRVATANEEIFDETGKQHFED